jgi:RDD family/GYF domain 2
MEKSWWYANGDQKIGALSLDELLQHLVSEQINLKTLVWKQGWENWLKLTDAEEIRAQVLEVMRERQAKIPPPLPHETVAVALPPPVLNQQPPKLDALTSTPSNSPIVYAGFWQRVAALTLDNLVLLVFFIPASLLQVYGHNNEFAAFIALVASAIYFTKMESGESGATYGKRWIGIKVLDLEGRRLTKGRASIPMDCSFPVLHHPVHWILHSTVHSAQTSLA